MSPWWIIPIAAVIAAAALLTVGRRKSRSGGTAMQAYVDGLRSMVAKDHRNAFVKLRQAVDLDTENIDAYLKLGDLFRQSGHVDRALQIHRELTLRQGVSGELRAEVRRSLVEDYIEGKLKSKAMETLLQMIKSGEQRPWAEDRLLEIHIGDENWSDAEELYRNIMKSRGIKESPTMSCIKLMMGRRLLDEEQFHKARLMYKEALSLNGTDPLPYLYIAESYLLEERVNDGLEYLKKMCENAPKQAHLGFPLIEDTLFNLGRFGEIEDIYRGVLNVDPDNIPTSIALAGILEKKGEIPAAESLLRSVLDSGRQSETAALKLARLLAASDRLEEGLEILSGVAEKASDYNGGIACKNCGKKARIPLPYCASCGSIGSYI